MTDRLTPQREAEITAREAAATKGPWGFYDGETYADVAADLQITGRGSYSYREKVACLEDENYWDDAAHEEDDEERASEQMAANAAFIAHSREDVPALLAELAAVRAERDQAQAELADYEPLNPQQCPAGKHADWLVDSEYAHACPWCRIAELEEDLRAVNAGWGVARAHIAKLERPAIEKQRNEIRDSYSELIAACNETKDYEGAFDVECRLRDREEQWKREDEEATR